MLEWISANIAYPLQNLRDPHHRLHAYRALQRTQWLPRTEHARRQAEALASAVRYAYQHCTYYRTRLEELGLDPTRLSFPDDLHRLPVLTKEDVRDHQLALISDEFTKDELLEMRTGGSTGTSLTVYVDHHCSAMRNSAAWRSDTWAGWTPGVARYALWGNPSTPRSLRARVRRILLDRTVYLDTVRVDEQTMEAFLRRYLSAARAVLFGHSHSLYLLATYVRDQALSPPPPLGIISTSMMLMENERRVIEEAFGCEVNDRYGCEEVGLIASQCERRAGMHINADHLVVEVLRPDGERCEPDEEGSLVLTDLLNRGMPLIRYAVGDAGVGSKESCPCGRGLPLLRRVTGRLADFLVRPDGALVAGVSLIERTLTAIPGIKQMQLVQDTLQELRVNLVPAAGFDAVSHDRLVAQLCEAMGGTVTISVATVNEIPRTAAGKFRFSICNVPRRSRGEA